jgi:hypothetical protein
MQLTVYSLCSPVCQKRGCDYLRALAIVTKATSTYSSTVCATKFWRICTTAFVIPERLEN